MVDLELHQGVITKMKALCISLCFYIVYSHAFVCVCVFLLPGLRLGRLKRREKQWESIGFFWLSFFFWPKFMGPDSKVGQAMGVKNKVK